MDECTHVCTVCIYCMYVCMYSMYVCMYVCRINGWMSCVLYIPSKYVRTKCVCVCDNVDAYDEYIHMYATLLHAL